MHFVRLINIAYILSYTFCSKYKTDLFELYTFKDYIYHKTAFKRNQPQEYVKLTKNLLKQVNQI